MKFGGYFYNEIGFGVSFFCLLDDLLWGVYKDGYNLYFGWIMGVEYEGGYFFDSIIKDYDVLCVVCLILYFMFIMVFVRNVCFDGWYLEYNGYLMFNVYCYIGELDYICVDLYFDVIFNS